MSRVSRSNIDLVVRTKSMDRGLAEGKSKLQAFQKDVSAMREQSEKFLQIGSALTGGAAGAALLNAPFRAASAIIDQFSRQAQEAVDAIEKFRTKGTPIVSSGLTPVGAVNAAANRDEASKLASSGFWKSFVDQSAGGGFDWASNFRKGSQFVGGFLGARVSQLYQGKVFGAGLFDDAIAAGMAASASTDEEANYYSFQRAQVNPDARRTYELWNRELGLGAPR